ncbi:MAG: lactococcin 972 family bacteriocin [Actinomycetaceae bacterium]|nr:lactococcin 972 family bacteriocin [Arcanobacterium sp.]MDD7505832.1 lactococcin 972 family bacteriocin [Actinomycetaceae bacterium]MDY6142857.1 lactococcin 972 family bacteriocin [Arcanobacterium sp.]
MKRLRNTVLAGVTALGLIVGGSSAAFAVSTLGGDWYYGTNYTTGNATSSFYHGSASHWTSIGTSSGKYARASAGAGKTASTWLWRTPGSSVTFKAGANGKTVTR